MWHFLIHYILGHDISWNDIFTVWHLCHYIQWNYFHDIAFQTCLGMLHDIMPISKEILAQERKRRQIRSYTLSILFNFRFYVAIHDSAEYSWGTYVQVGTRILLLNLSNWKMSCLVKRSYAIACLIHFILETPHRLYHPPNVVIVHSNNISNRNTRTASSLIRSLTPSLKPRLENLKCHFRIFGRSATPSVTTAATTTTATTATPRSHSPSNQSPKPRYGKINVKCQLVDFSLDLLRLLVGASALG